MLFPSFFNAGKPTYEIEQSLRFRGNNTYFTKTFGSSGDRRKFTLSVWVKKATVTAVSPNNTGLNFFGANSGSVGDSMNVGMNADTTAIQFYQYNSGYAGGIFSDARYRDPSAWMHMVFVWDSAQATQSDRMAVYVNNRIERPDGSAGSPDTGPSLNKDAAWNNSSYTHTIGGTYQTNDMYIAEAYHIDGQALDPTSFGEYDKSGVWRPIEYTGTYSGNSFYLKFDPSATNGIGHDHSGLGNNWSPTGFTTTGTGTDVMSDTPTTNWCTLNPLFINNTEGPGTLSEGNLRHTSDDNYAMCPGTMSLRNGKYYWEAQPISIGTSIVGIIRGMKPAESTYVGYDPNGNVFGFGYQNNGYVYGATGTGTSTGNAISTSQNTFTTTDVIGIAVDIPNGTLDWYKNGTLEYSVTGINDDDWFPAVSSYTSDTWEVNFGQREFVYPPGTSSATEYFNTVTYTGNGTSQSITGVGFQPDFVWIKKTDTSGNHMLTDSVTGANKELNSNTTAQQTDNTNALTSFDSDGFSVGSDGAVNINNEDLVAWCWSAGGGSSVTRSDDGGGDSSDYGNMQTTTLKSSAESGLAIATWTSNGSSDFIAHDLGAEPDLVIVKRTDDTGDWYVYDRYSSGRSYYSKLNSTASRVTSIDFWGNSSRVPTATKFPITGLVSGTSGQDFVAYLFRSVEGVVKSGYYQGNGSPSDGPYIETGFSPSMILIKRTYGGTGGWIMLDKARDSTNPNDTRIEAQSSYQNYTIGGVDFQSNGFKLRTNNAEWNVSGSEYIYIAFAENFIADETHKSLNTANLPAPTVKDGSDYFNTVLYSGNGSTQSITGVGFQPDWVLIKDRVNSADNWNTFDAVRGATKVIRPNLNHAEITDANSLTSFDSDGFSLGNRLEVNRSTSTFASWNWLAGGIGSSNTDGDITSTVSANLSAGFSIVSYTGNGQSGATVGHGLNVAPSMIIVKDRDAGRDWAVYHEALGATKNLFLNLTNSAATDSGVWTNTAPTSTVFTVGTSAYTNYGNLSTGDDFIAYCFAEVEGYSKFGLITPNYNANGPFVYLGFTPAFLMFKNAERSGTDWVLIDATRDPYNYAGRTLRPNLPNIEDTYTEKLDILSNGFKIRTTDLSYNGPDTSPGIIYAAFAQHPLGGSGVTPATAR